MRTPANHSSRLNCFENEDMQAGDITYREASDGQKEIITDVEGIHRYLEAPLDAVTCSSGRGFPEKGAENCIEPESIHIEGEKLRGNLKLGRTITDARKLLRNIATNQREREQCWNLAEFRFLLRLNDL
ncbi:hypothetical protein BS17DRAFT_820067 [Gyrodon lividus]|nr:hypothetical protein BS17DRAFT_820067 [Gyrodon lividus]